MFKYGFVKCIGNVIMIIKKYLERLVKEVKIIAYRVSRTYVF